jgi:primosomal protein N' (replication factor Y)
VISADTALYLPDYRSGERTFQLLTQVAGRAGRGLLGGQVILQTYAPGHYAIQAATGHDFNAFYYKEMRYRAELGYPPYNRLARLEVRETSSQRARQAAEKLHAILSSRIAEQQKVQTTLIGPAPCFFPRRDNLHRWQVIVRGPDPVHILHDIHVTAEIFIDVDPVSLL